MEKRWVFTGVDNDDFVNSLQDQLALQYPPVRLQKPLVSLLINRNLKTVDSIKNFFFHDINKLHDPFLMKDMDKAVERLSKAIINNEKILIYGDYDVDGTSSVALLYSFIRDIIGKGFEKYIEYYIPDRYTEGYGISDKGINYCADNGFKLLISLDCGIKANDKIDRANQFGIDVIVCDHHFAGDQLPAAYAVLDPKRSDCEYPFKELSGCGVGFKLIQAYCYKYNMPDEIWLSKIDLVAISIASDIVAITDENRILTYFGLISINKFPRIGIKSIIEQSGIRIKYPLDRENTIFEREITVADLVFYVGPRINAAGRMKTGRESVHLMICDDENKSQELGTNINNHNDERRELDKRATDEAIIIVNNSPDFKEKKSIVLYNPEWNKGIIGIVASRLVEEFYKPTIILTCSPDGLITGSARSVKGFDIYSAIDSCSELLAHFGGHTFAAGLSLELDNLATFSEKFEKLVAENLQRHSLNPEIDVDLELDLGDISKEFIDNLNKFAPFGPHNMPPVFLSTNVIDDGWGKVVGKKHLKMRFLYPHKSVQPIDAIFFNGKAQLLSLCEEKMKNDKPFFDKLYKHLKITDMSDIDLEKNLSKILSFEEFDILYHIEENYWKNTVSRQLNIQDMHFSKNKKISF